MEIWTRLIEGQNLKLRCRCFASCFLAVMQCLLFFFRGIAVWTVPQCPPQYYTLNLLQNNKTFLHVIYKSKKKTNLVCIKKNVFKYSKIRTQSEMQRKALKQKKKFGIQPFLESGIH